MTTKFIIDNLEALLAAVEAQPENLFDLGSWREETKCGTIFCVAGLACSMPRFQALGMTWCRPTPERDDYPEYKGTAMFDGGGDELFGEESMRHLFRTAGDGTLDNQLGIPNTYKDDDTCDDEFFLPDCTDKELAVARLKHRIATYKEQQNVQV